MKEQDDRRFSVVVRKGAVDVVFRVCDGQREAELTVVGLESIGLPPGRARVTPARFDDSPGRTRARQRVATA